MQDPSLLPLALALVLSLCLALRAGGGRDRPICAHCGLPVEQARPGERLCSCRRDPRR